MDKKTGKGLRRFLFIAFWIMTTSPGFALQLDWNGQFWFENHWLNNYQLDRTRPGYDADQDLINRGGPYVPGGGEKNVVWWSAFFKLKPKIIVNDSINIKSEWHLGSPVYGFLGRGFPQSKDDRYNFTASGKEGMAVSAQRYWANLITDFGTIELGRAPIHWGLGAIWNQGDQLWDRYQSTGDLIRLTSKFGNFILMPALIKASAGNNVAGASDTTTGSILEGNDDITDYQLTARYDNPEEDFEIGFMWNRRTGNVAQRSVYFNSSELGSNRMDFSLFDLYAKKKTGRFSFGLEIPYYSGSIGALDGQNEFTYRAFAGVLEAAYNSDLWDVTLKTGHVPGQRSISAGDKRFQAVYLHRDYQLGLIMFHYNLFGLARNNPDTVANKANQNSPFDAAIVNANYVALTPQYRLDKWTFKASWIMAWADQTAVGGKRAYSYHQRRFYDAVQSQSKFLGKELDIGATFRWDENFIVGWDMGLFFPGAYYEYLNHPQISNRNHFLFASQARVGITF